MFYFGVGLNFQRNFQSRSSERGVRPRLTPCSKAHALKVKLGGRTTPMRNFATYSRRIRFRYIYIYIYIARVFSGEAERKTRAAQGDAFEMHFKTDQNAMHCTVGVLEWSPHDQPRRNFKILHFNSRFHPWMGNARRTRTPADPGPARLKEKPTPNSTSVTGDGRCIHFARNLRSPNFARIILSPRKSPTPPAAREGASHFLWVVDCLLNPGAPTQKRVILVTVCRRFPCAKFDRRGDPELDFQTSGGIDGRRPAETKNTGSTGAGEHPTPNRMCLAVRLKF